MTNYLTHRSQHYWESAPYVQVCVIPDCEIELADKAHEWAHSWFHIIENKRLMKKYLGRTK